MAAEPPEVKALVRGVTGQPQASQAPNSLPGPICPLPMPPWREIQFPSSHTAVPHTDTFYLVSQLSAPSQPSRSPALVAFPRTLRFHTVLTLGGDPGMSPGP